MTDIIGTRRKDEDGLPLFTPTERFDGRTFEQEKDGQRLAAQHARIARLMSDSGWRTLGEIASETGDPEASVSARLRDFRKPRFGGWDVQRRRRSGGTYEYRIVAPEAA